MDPPDAQHSLEPPSRRAEAMRAVALTGAGLKARWSDPAQREAHSDRMRRQWQDPAYRERIALKRRGPDYPNVPRIHRLKKFGLTIAEYDALLAAQEGKCALCRKPEAKKNRRLAVDHHHDSGQVRGLLCTNCNTALGLLGDDVQLLAAAIAYLNPA